MLPTVDTFLELLSSGGIDTVYGNPGTFEQGFLDAIAARPQFKYVLCLHETVAVGAAIGHARVTRSPACIQLHGCVGLGNAVAMILEAKQSHVPMLIYIGENSQEAESQKGFLAYDSSSIAKEVCKHVVRVTAADQVASQVQQAIQIAKTAPCGPSAVIVPMDVLGSECEASAVPVEDAPLAGLPSEDELQRIATLLLNARNPVILAGDCVGWSRTQSLVGQIATLLAAPIYGIGWTMCNVHYQQPLFQECLSHAQGERNASIIRQFDVVLSLGTPLAWEVFPSKQSYLAPGAKLVHIDVDPAEIGRNYKAEIGIHANLSELLPKLVEFLSRSTLEHGKESLRQRREFWVQQKQQESHALVCKWVDAARQRPNHPYGMLKELARYLPPDAIIIEEAMTAQPPLRHAFPLGDPDCYFPALSRPLGAGLAGAIGAAVAAPDRSIVCVTSDGAALYVPQALWTAANQNLNLLVIVANNSSYRVLKLNLDDYRRKHGFPNIPYPFMDIKNPEIDFVTLATSMGVRGVRINDPGEIRNFSTHIECVGPRLIDLRISGDIDL